MTLTRQAAAVSLALLAIVTVMVLFVAPRLTGGAALTILSGSMTPTYPVGSVVVVRPVEPADVHEGDVITYAEPGGSFTTHRVVDVNTDPSGEYSFTTKGDANRGEDTDPVTAEALRGKVWFSVPYLGRVREAVSSPAGILGIGALVALALSWERLRSMVRRFPRPPRPVTIPAAGESGADEARAPATTVPSPGSTPATAFAVSDLPTFPDSAISTAARLHTSPTITVPTVAPVGSTPRATVDGTARQQLLVLRLGVGWLERREVMDLLPLIRGHVVAIGPGSLSLAVVGTPTHLDSVEEMLEQYPVTHCGRSSVVALIARPPTAPASPRVPRSTQEAH